MPFANSNCFVSFYLLLNCISRVFTFFVILQVRHSFFSKINSWLFWWILPFYLNTLTYIKQNISFSYIQLIYFCRPLFPLEWNCVVVGWRIITLEHWNRRTVCWLFAFTLLLSQCYVNSFPIESVEYEIRNI